MTENWQIVIYCENPISATFATPSHGKIYVFKGNNSVAQSLLQSWDFLWKAQQKKTMGPSTKMRQKMHQKQNKNKDFFKKSADIFLAPKQWVCL